eukprot:TRINITY_DN2583_c0_g5_i1.p1 TRINITY_DN2583_c0_g5~~TRINITY_DN2583_c0_g5_i1.p1  ORF type:complete len:237 (+),score=55.31 TRINITY_DN2583_c0_g5_i1:46-756(+)
MATLVFARPLWPLVAMLMLLPGVDCEIDYGKGKFITELTEANFDAVVYDSAKNVLVSFYAPWCEHSQRIMPRLNLLAWEYRHGPKKQFHDKILIAAVDCDTNPALCKERFDIPGYPYLKYFTWETDVVGHDYQKPMFSQGERATFRRKTLEDFRMFAEEVMERVCSDDAEEYCTDKQRKYIAKYSSRSVADLKEQMARIQGMKGTLTLENRRWNAQRLGLLLRLLLKATAGGNNEL